MNTSMKWAPSLAVLALFYVSAAVNAQEPIVRLEVKPKNPNFGNWNKPTLLRSAADAAKVFDKDALAALTKQVDFKKQFVIVFAWRGSGGDKLEFTIAESFPEQIAFSLKPGLTDDIHPHVQVFALRSNVRTSIKGADGKQERIEAQPAAVRPLKFMPADPTIVFTLGGKANAITLADAAAVEKLVGKASSRALIELVNFEKEMIVFVSWNTSGPPDGKLQHELKGNDENRKLTFYVQGPPGGGARGQRLRIGADFFAVPRNLAVTFDPKER